MRAREVGIDDIAAANLITRLHRTESEYLMRWNQAAPFWSWNVVRTLQGPVSEQIYCIKMMLGA